MKDFSNRSEKQGNRASFSDFVVRTELFLGVLLLGLTAFGITLL